MMEIVPQILTWNGVNTLNGQQITEAGLCVVDVPEDHSVIAIGNFEKVVANTLGVEYEFNQFGTPDVILGGWRTINGNRKPSRLRISSIVVPDEQELIADYTLERQDAPSVQCWVEYTKDGAEPICIESIERADDTNRSTTALGQLATENSPLQVVPKSRPWGGITRGRQVGI